jgi:hypothetical protein
METAIHVGLHKTGTTTLQNAIFPCLPGITYLGRSKKPNIGPALRARGTRRLLFSDETILGRLVDLYHTPIRSETWGQLQCNAMDSLAAANPGAKLILGIRHYETWVLSLYRHYIKYGGRNGLAKFIGYGADAALSPNDLLIANRIEHARRTFNRGVFVYQLEELARDPAGVTERLCGFLGVGTPSAIVPSQHNAGLRWAGLQVARLMNKLPVLGGMDHPDYDDGWRLVAKRARVTPYFAGKVLDRVTPEVITVRLPYTIRKMLDDELSCDYLKAVALAGD